jgi:hypothetical protein
VDEARVAVRQRDRYPGGNDRSLARRQLDVHRGVQVRARVARLRVRRHRQVGVETAELDAKGRHERRP